jgi:copper homeostasis protein (lipoprotein)
MSDHHSLSRSLLFLGTVSVFGVAACAGESEQIRAGGVASERLMPITNAMSWRADLPCADCPGIRTTVTLLPDGSYRRDDAYLGTGEAGDSIFGEVGRYILDRSGELLTLHGGEGPGYFTALADGNLRMRDQTGEEIDSELDYTLVHLPNPVRQEGLVRLSGLFTYYADTALLLERQGGVQLPVAMLGENLA